MLGIVLRLFHTASHLLFFNNSEQKRLNSLWWNCNWVMLRCCPYPHRWCVWRSWETKARVSYPAEWTSLCISAEFSNCGDQIPDKQKLWGERAPFGSQFKDGYSLWWWGDKGAKSMGRLFILCMWVGSREGMHSGTRLWNLKIHPGTQVCRHGFTS